MTESMWRDLSEEERTWKEKCRAFADTFIRPGVRRHDQENTFPREVHAAAYQHGLMNVAIPEKLGGQGKGHRFLAVGGEELAAVCAPTAFGLGFNHGSLRPVIHAGTSEQKQVFVRDLLGRRGYASLCMTEPDCSGSNLLAIESEAHRTDRGWSVSGTKCMVGVGTEAEVYFVLANAIEGGRNLGLTMVAVPRKDGVIVGENVDKLGFRPVPTPTIEFQDVEVPAENVIGAPGEAEMILMDCLDFMRYGGVPVILGMVVGGLRDLIPWLEERRVAPNDPLVTKTHVQMTLGRIYSELQVVRLLLWRTAELLDRGQPCATEAAIAKAKASSLAVEATQEFVQLMGWRGLHADYTAQKRLRDARASAIYEGTNELLLLHAFFELRRQAHQGGHF